VRGGGVAPTDRACGFPHHFIATHGRTGAFKVEGVYHVMHWYKLMEVMHTSY